MPRAVAAITTARIGLLRTASARCPGTCRLSVAMTTQMRCVGARPIISALTRTRPPNRWWSLSSITGRRRGRTSSPPQRWDLRPMSPIAPMHVRATASVSRARVFVTRAGTARIVRSRFARRPARTVAPARPRIPVSALQAGRAVIVWIPSVRIPARTARVRRRTRASVFRGGVDRFAKMRFAIRPAFMVPA